MTGIGEKRRTDNQTAYHMLHCVCPGGSFWGLPPGHCLLTCSAFVGVKSPTKFIFGLFLRIAILFL